LKALEKRFQFLISEAHLMSNMLDPRYLGDSLTRLAKENVEDLILGFDENNSTDLFQEYTDSLITAGEQRSKKKLQFNALIDGKKTISKYWKIEGASWPNLQMLANKLF
jgi:hypothetical protein